MLCYTILHCWLCLPCPAWIPCAGNKNDLCAEEFDFAADDQHALVAAAGDQHALVAGDQHALVAADDQHALVAAAGDHALAVAVVGCRGGGAARTPRAPGCPGPSKRTPDQHAQVVRMMNDAREIQRLKRKNPEEETPSAPAVQSSILPLRVAACPTSSVSAIALKFNRDRKCIRNMMSQVALAIDKHLSDMLTALQTDLQHKTILLAWEHGKHDDAKQRLALAYHSDLSRDQQISSYDIVTKYCRVGWWEAGAGVAPLRREIRVPLRPVVLIGSKTAGTYWCALFKQQSEASHT